MKSPPAPRRRDHAWLNAWADSRIVDPSPLWTAVRSLVRLILVTTREFRHNALSLRSGALTYAILLSLVPTLAISTAVVKGLGGGDQLRKAAYTYIETLEEGKSDTPSDSVTASPAEPTSPEDGENLTDRLRSVVGKVFDYVDKTNFATLGTVGVAGILLTVIMVLGTVEETMNVIWKVQAGKPLLRKIADYLALLIRKYSLCRQRLSEKSGSGRKNEYADSFRPDPGVSAEDSTGSEYNSDLLRDVYLFP